MDADFGLAFGLLTTAVLASLFGLLIVSILNGPRPRIGNSVFGMNSQGIVFLFDGETLIDATPAARALLADSPVHGTPWTQLMARLGPRFADLEKTVLALPREGQVRLQGAPMKDGSDGLSLFAELAGGVTKIALSDGSITTSTDGPSPLMYKAQSDELGELRHIIAQSPALIWREREDGDVIWANASYLMLVAERLQPGQDLGWPLPRLFDRMASAQAASGQRQRLDVQGGPPRWFDIVGTVQGPDRLVFALSADSAVQAETALRDFMQTLTRTFANLPIGLAVFDRNRKLQLFNPALSDLTSLQPEFLTARPSLVGFLDALREKSMIPEPKDYRSWRKQMVDLEAAASSGVHEETWSLPGGQTYRVIGRPHPNGAVAFMFEDISSEILRTRRYRADLELSQAVIDMLEEGIAVFSYSGSLVMTNAAYAELWAHNPSEGLRDVSAGAMVRFWRDRTAPTALWNSAEDYLALLGDRDPWDGEARLTDGRLMSCRFSHVAGGATMVTFRMVAADAPGLSVQQESGRLSA
ncbi:MAG: PAS-domain containing protein [Pseudomonadota bacterium]